ncbi:hypothetical protein OI25_7949 (plasmid) [Paraburkholderia fungorum]|jgi:hypothetical protein|uniref:DUF4148 domain-containing protein n=1 Tax=Paraburkholderia fungorum TaxID=134537 RepID=A0AAU8SQE3_9BURK|nr:hypothetical protein [Paraburkholderia fungorum]AJZ56163.1 hypothetical protein OI25_7949 [Paraburkholderia fungorum]MBU7443230.1 hypothetical protein [Paraburkholderia fungorum]MDE1012110.1 hypothetical protein [Paraburkholderia fungorum]PNE59245.1 hypothetical protein A8H39_02640 [Paraburkholderia fungorum]PRZ41869.1 hypothetical protein BX589_1629 [Paraburkholderia fungorum]
MRMFIAALLGASALLPALVHATTTFPDPADAAASVPGVSVLSAFADYHPYRDQKASTWQELNQAVTNSSGMKGMSHGSMPGGGTDAKNNEHSSRHEEPAK